jgi:putative membrane-bound dehydrogenase-like protein
MNPTRLSSLSLALLLTLCGSAREQKTSNAPFLKPAEAVAKMEFPEEFAVSIYAAEPDIGEPIAFTFDARGRVWVVENYNYVNRRSHTGDPRTRIRIFEDTDRDGTFDTKKLFTDQLTFSSGIAVGFGGVFVGSPPNFQFIPDADGDDVPDGPPEILLDGWGIHDRHETLNSFIWGPDGWLYGCHGVFTRSLVGKPGAPPKDRQFIDAGIWRYHPVRREFEVFAHGLSNPWGFDFNDEGQAFATCCVIPHLFHVIQGGVYHKQSKPHVNPYVFDDIKTIRDHTHRSAHGGARFYLADAFPEPYRDRLFMCNIHQHQVLTDVMVRKGSGFVGKHGDDFLTTNDPAWVGFSVEIGPEGGVYILDWHDTDICGNAINFPNSGRIYRIMPKDAKPVPRPNLRNAADLELVAMQQHPNDWFVRQARVELQSRAADGTLDRTAVHAELDRQFTMAPDSGRRLRALWAQHVTGRFDDKARSDLLALLRHDDEYVRAWTVQLLCEERKPGSAALSTFLDLAQHDPSPVVRLYLASALQRLTFDQRWPLLAALAQHEEDADDHNIPRMLWFALEPMVPAHPAKALDLAVQSHIPMLQEHTARRMVSGGTSDPPNAAAKQAAWTRTLQLIAPGFTPRNVGEGGVVALSSFRNEPAVQTHPKDRKTACELVRRLTVSAGKTTTLRIRASYHPHGDWQLRVLANKQVLADQIVSSQTVDGEWLDLDLDLTRFSGQAIDLSIENRANNWMNEFGYWGRITVASE